MAQTPPTRWFKGNTHTHTLNSDGDSTPDDVVKWYREHGYQFLVLTDHNVLTNVDSLNALHAAPGQFLVIKGEEVTDRFGDLHLHVDAMERGDVYASTGVVLKDYQVSRERITVDVQPTPYSKYRIQFIGAGGRVLKEVAAPTATYEVTGAEGYVRAKVIESNGQVAWTQQVVVR
jgi:hypothetical protein